MANVILVSPDESDDLQLSVTFGAANKAKYFSKKIAAWDPAKHPKGAKGLFIETPDKVKAKDVKPGDVVAAKSGKAFQVEKATDKGVKVKPIDIVTGEVKSGYTVLGHDVDLAVVESAKSPGTVHAVKDLEPGTYIKTKAGKRFKVTKHGKWTTVYPVDDKGEVSGKHTVLPPETAVTVDAPEYAPEVTAKVIKEIDQVILGYTGATPGGDWAQGLVGGDFLKDKEDGSLGVVTQTMAKGVWVAVVTTDGHVTSDPFFESFADVEAHYHPAISSDKPLFHTLQAGDTLVNPDGEQIIIKASAKGSNKVLFTDHYGDEGYLTPSSFKSQGWKPILPQKGEKWTDEFGQEWLITDASSLGISLKTPGGITASKTAAEMVNWHKTDVAVDLGIKEPEGPKKVDEKPPDGDAFAAWLTDYFGLFDKDSVLENYVEAGHTPYAPVTLDQGNNYVASLVAEAYDGEDYTEALNDAQKAFHVWHEHSTTPIYEGQPDPEEIAKKVLAQAEDQYLSPMHQAVLVASKKLQEPGGIDHSKPIKQTAEWQMVEGYMLQQHGVALEDLYDQAMSEWVIKGDEGQKGTVLSEVDVWKNPEAKLAVQDSVLSAVYDFSTKNAPYEIDGDTKDEWLADHLQFLDQEGDGTTIEDPHKLALWLADFGLGSTGIYTDQGVDLQPQIKEAYDQAVAQALDTLKAEQGAKSVQKQVEEILPQKLPKVPKPYPPGVGKDTKLIIEHDPNKDYFRVIRVNKDGKELQVVGSTGGVAAARTMARNASGAHEPIQEHTILTKAGFKYAEQDFQIGQYVINGQGQIFRLESVDEEHKTDYSGKPYVIKNAIWSAVGLKDGSLVTTPHNNSGSYTGKSLAGQYMVALTEDEVLGFVDKYGLGKDPTKPAVENGGYALAEPGSIYQTLRLPKEGRWEAMKLKGAAQVNESTIRKAHPEKYSPYLHSEWNAEELIGASVNDSLKALGKLGYREIKPRLKDQVRVINANGARLILHREGTTITGVTKPEVPTLHIDGTAKDMYAQLAETIASGGEVASIDFDGMPAEVRTSLTRRMLYDMAQGKQRGVAEKLGKAANDVKVKSDAAYVKEIEAEGGIESVEHFKEQMSGNEIPDIKVKARGAIIEALGDKDNPEWDFPNRMLTVTPGGVAAYGDATPSNRASVIAAADALINNQGVATVWLGKENVSWEVFGDPTIPEGGLRAHAPEQGSKTGWLHAATTLAAEFEKADSGEPSLLDQLDDGTREYVMSRMSASLTQAHERIKARDAEWTQRAENIRAQKLKAEIDKRRTAEGTVPEPLSAQQTFDVPTWDEIEFEHQSWEDIDQHVGSIGDTPYDVPAFYSGGVFKDAVLQHRAQETQGEVPLDFDALVVERLTMAGAQPGVQSDAMKQYYNSWVKLEPGNVLVLQDGDRRIEYVKHDQPGAGVPTSQRGRLRAVGYTPKEAAEKLKELGLVGDLEPEVPFKAMFRGTRRHGRVVSIHREYVNGTADPPKIKARLTHGITGSGDNVQILKDILESGGLMSIAERHRMGILDKTTGVSVLGDIGSGIDHCVFTTFNSGGACGSSSGVKFVFKPSAYLTRDVTFAPSDFGGGNNRYPSYKNYLNKLQAQVGESKTNLYEPFSPKVRQAHINGVSVTASSEFNIGPSIPIEDMEAIGVPDHAIAQIDALLDTMLASGKIASRPKVVTVNEATLLGQKGL